MERETTLMIEAMEKSIVLVEKRVRAARRDDTLVCIQCMEEELPWMRSQLGAAVRYRQVLEKPDATILERLDAYWAIQDTHASVQSMREKTDTHWNRKIRLP